MAVSVAIRLGAGFVAFAILARALGPQDFGVLMLWFSVSILASCIPNYGLTTYVLREVGANPESAGALINEGVTGKLLLSCIVIAVALLLVGVYADGQALLVVALLVASIADTFSEFLNACIRAKDRFGVETRLATVSSLLHLGLVALAMIFMPSTLMAATAILVSRLCILGLTVVVMGYVGITVRLVSMRRALERLKAAVSYGLDFGLQSLFGQIDSVVLNHFSGPAAVGVHQAGMRIFFGGAQLAPILANVYLPQIAASPKLGGQYGWSMQAIFVVFGALFGVAFALLPRELIVLMFGDGFAGLAALLPLFGLLFFLRFVAAAWGVLLTAGGEQTYRMGAGVLQWIVIAVAAFILVPKWANAGWLMALCIGTAALAVFYFLRAQRHGAKSWAVIGLTAFGALPFAFLVKVG